MSVLTLSGLDGSNPLGYLAALGALAVADQQLASARLAWDDRVVPVPVLHVTGERDDLVAAVLEDRDAWRGSPALEHPAGGKPAGDVKFPPAQLREWLERCAAHEAQDGERALRLVAALVAEGSVANKGEAKPTDLHFTAGQQQFLDMARTLRDELTADHVVEALFGPWRYDSTLPSFKWDVTDDRTYALAAVNPADETKRTVPGAEWLALMGLALLPVAWRRRRTVTPGCAGSWKSGSFTWPIWSGALTVDAVRSTVGLRELVEDPLPSALLLRGIVRVYRSVVTRSDQGGYGSFRPPRVVLDVVSS